MEINRSSQKTLSKDVFYSELTSKFSFANEQQDSYELFHRIMDLFNHSIEEKNPFLIELETTFYCGLCKTSIKKIQKEINLSFDSTNSSIKSLQTELSQFGKISLIDDYVCSSCTLQSLIKQINPMSKNLTLLNYLNTLKQKDSSLEELVEEILSFCDNNNYNEEIKRVRFKPVKTTLQKSTEIKKTNENLLIHIAYVS